MSLLNKMLRDLEHRRADDEEASPGVAGVKAVAPPAGRRRPMILLGVLALVAVAAAAVTHELPGFWRPTSEGGMRVTPKVKPGQSKIVTTPEASSPDTPGVSNAAPVAVQSAVSPDQEVPEVTLLRELRIAAEIETPIKSELPSPPPAAEVTVSKSPSSGAQAVRVVDNALQVEGRATADPAAQSPSIGATDPQSPGTVQQHSTGARADASPVAMSGGSPGAMTGDAHGATKDGSPGAGQERSPAAAKGRPLHATRDSSPDAARSPSSSEARQQAARVPVSRLDASVAAIEKNLREPDARQRAAQAVESGLQSMARKQYSEARRAFHAALALDPHNDRARQALLSALLAMDDKQAAEPIADEGMLQGMAKVGFALVSARLKLERGAVKEALAVLERERAAGAAHADYLALWGNALSREARYGDAAQMYAAAVERAPANPAHHVGLGYALRNDGQFSSAYAVFQSVAEMPGLSPQLADLVEQQLGSLQRLLVKR